MAVAYGSAGAGAGTESNGASLDLACPASVAAGDVLVAHVTFEGLTNAPSEPADWDLLYGPADLGTGTAVGRSWVYGKIAVGDEDGDTIGFGSHANTSGRYGRIYSFTGVTSGTLAEVCTGFSDTATEGSIPLPTVTTQQAGALAVALLVQDDNNSFAAAGAVTGGTWAEPVAEFVSTTLGVQGCCVGIQTSTPTGNPGTITGGTANATADEGSTIGFSIEPDPPPVFDPPTFEAEYEVSSWASSTTPKTVSLTNSDGDVLVCIGIGADQGDTLSTPSGGSGLSWTLQEEVNVGSQSRVYLWTTTATAANSGATISVSRTAGSNHWGFTIWRYSGSDGIGDTNKANSGSGAPSVAVTTLQNNSAVVAGNSDWNVGSGARTWRTINSITPTSGNGLEKTYEVCSGNMTVYGAVWNDVGSTGVKTAGLTAPSQTYSIVAAEVKGTEAGGTTDATVNATAIATTTALPAPALQTGSTFTTTAIATTTALPKAVIPVVAKTIATATALPAPTISTGSTVAATAIVTATALPAPSLSTGSTVVATTIATTTALPAPTVSTGSNATVVATAIVTSTAMPAPTVQTGSTVAATTVATTVAMPAPVLQTGSTVTPPVIATVAALPVPTVSVGSNATVTATSIVTVTALPAPVVQTGSTVSAVTITTVTAMPVPTVTVGGNATITAVTIATTTAMPTPSLSTGQRVNPPVVATTTAMPAPTVSSNATIVAVTIATVTAMPVPSFHTGSTIAASVIGTMVAMAAPFLPTQVTYGTGGASSRPVSTGQAGQGTAASGNAGSSLAGSGRAGRG